MQKILYLITKSDIGGAQRYVADLAASLDSRSFSSTILSGGRDIRWLDNAQRPYVLFLNDLFAVFEIVRTLSREHPDILHLNSSKTGVIGALAAFIYNLTRPRSVNRVRVIFTAHGWVFNPTNDLSRFTRACYVALHRIAARFTDTIITVSDYDYRLALDYAIAPASRLVTIHNGIDARMKFLERAEAKTELLRRLPIPDAIHRELDSKPWVGSLGRLTKEKDFGTFIMAAHQIPNASFFIIGDGIEKERLVTLIATLGLTHRFFIVPPRGNDAKLLKAFDVFALSSIKEGFPYSLLEALAAGLPTVVTNAGGMPEAAQACAVASVVPIRNPAALAQGIRATLTRKPARGACIPFTLAAMISDTTAVYQRITKPTSGRQAAS